ncbi:Uma2 family endonuclease [Streptomyces sp. XC 2026]|nr:Uma2 family endonuclease [Streptomyces sp. XC 2026]
MGAATMTSAAPDSAPDWAHPPAGGYTAEDLDTLPGLPPHTELIDGSLVFMIPQTKFHLRVLRLFEQGLLRTVPDHLEVLREFNVILGKQQRPEPDVMVARADADTGDLQTAVHAADAVLVIEVVSPESEGRDRETKPIKYARAGIPHFWRVERGDDGLPVVFAYALDKATGAYGLTGIHHHRLKVTVPFVIDIDLSAASRR